MNLTITLELVDEVPTDSRVCHYDELGEDAKEKFPILTETIGISVNSTIVDELQEYDLVKYTGYYEVSIG